MSINLMSMVWQMTDLNQTDTLVLLALADHANDQGICWPGHDTVAKKARISRRTVIRTIEKLIHDGLLNVESSYRSNKSQTANVYRLNVKAMCHRVTLLHDQCDTIVSHSTPEQCDKNGGQCDIAMSSLEPSKNQNLLPPQKSGTALVDPSKAEHAWFVAWWCWSVQRITSARYDFTKGDAGMVKRLLRSLGFDELMNRASVYLLFADGQRFPRGSPTVKGLSGMINQIAGQWSSTTDDHMIARGLLPRDMDLTTFAPWRT